MVEAVIQYKTFDGRIFPTEGQATKWEHKANQAKLVMDMFPDNDKLGMGDYYQLSMKLVSDARAKLVKALLETYKDKDVEGFKEGYRGSIIGRFLSDGDSPYYKAWWMFECIDDQGRMFNQPYYVGHPEEAKTQIAY